MYNIMQVLMLVSGVAFWVNLIILIFLGPFRKTRGFAGATLLYSSFLFGLTAWLAGLFLTYGFWGIIGVIVGLFILGIGVVPIGLLACIFNSAWGPFWTLAILVAITFGARIIGFSLVSSLEEKNEPERVFDTTATWEEEPKEIDSE